MWTTENTGTGGRIRSGCVYRGCVKDVGWVASFAVFPRQILCLHAVRWLRCNHDRRWFPPSRCFPRIVADYTVYADKEARKRQMNQFT